MTPSKKWLALYEEKRRLMVCATDLSEYFTAAEIAGKKLDRMSVGMASLPSGRVIVSDPLAGLGKHSEPYFHAVAPGEYEVVVAVVVSDGDDCDRYAAARMRFTDAEAVRYEEALTGEEDIAEVEEEGDGFGFPVDAGLACICDERTRDAFLAFDKEWRKKAGKDANLYDDYFAGLMAENYQKSPQYQRDGGDWLNWNIPGTGYCIPIFQSGFGDGFYPVWFGYDKDGRICSLVVQFIDIEAAYSDG
ncbi:MAG: DUF4241 domain-containing protein [Methanomassiliicoccaceae archaeon]|nr:DUF4241 domain-containing protein [Methanomassiliicoccaceae archaeon]